jgi:hypothetical protein
MSHVSPAELSQNPTQSMCARGGRGTFSEKLKEMFLQEHYSFCSLLTTRVQFEKCSCRNTVENFEALSRVLDSRGTVGAQYDDRSHLKPDCSFRP